MEIPLREDSIIVCHRLRVSEIPNEEGEFGVIRWDTDSNISVTKEVLSQILLLQNGKSIGETAHQLGTSIDEVKDTVVFLLDMEFIKSVNEIEISTIETRIHPFLVHVPRKYFSWMIHPFVLIPIFLFTVSGLIIGFTFLGYIPTFLDYFWSQNLLVSLLTYHILNYTFVMLHEIGHFIATKACGGEAVIRVSHRFIDLVFETEFYHLSISPAIYRFLVYIFGMFLDLFVIAVVFWIYIANRLWGLPIGFLQPILPVILLIEIYGVVWQFGTILQTDIYNIVAEFYNRGDLSLDTRKYLLKGTYHWYRRFFAPFATKTHVELLKYVDLKYASDFRSITKSDRTVFIFYILMAAIGYLVTTLSFFYLTLSRNFIFIMVSAFQLWYGIINRQWHIVFMSICVLLLVGHQIPILITFFVRSWRKKRHKYETK